jgi:hypothetical protein
MSDDRIASLLGDHVVLTSVAATTWRKVTTGELTPDEAADLLGSSDEERERARRFFGPLTPEQRQEQREALLARLAQEGRAPAAPAEATVVVAPTVTPPPVRMVPRWKRWAAVAFSAAAVSAAAAVLLTAMPPTPSNAPTAFVAVYRADALQGLEAQRGSTAKRDTVSYLPDGKLELVLRPEHDVEPDIEVVGFARGSSGGVIRLRLAPQVSANGVVVIETTPSELGLTAGEHELVLAVGPGQALPASWEELELAEPRGAARGYETVWIEQRIHVITPIAAPVRYAGCAEVWLEPKPRCVFDPTQELLLWIDDVDPARVEVRVNAMPWAYETQRVDDLAGVRLRGRLPADATILELTLVGEAVEPWSLPLVAQGTASPASGIRTSKDIDKDLEDAFNDARDGKHQQALDRLDAVEAEAGLYPKGHADHATYRGIALWWQGRFYDAAVSLRQGVVFATALEDPDLEGDALPMYAAVLAELGYIDAAIHWATLIQSFVLDDERFPCEARAQLLSTLGWVHLVSAMQDGLPLTTARALLEEGSSLVGPGGECPEPIAVPGLSLSLALVDLREGRAADAHARLLGIDQDQATRDERLRIRDADAQALLALGDPDAAAVAIDRLAEAVTYDDTPEGRWRLALREGDLLVLQGRGEQAVEAYRRAEQHSLEILELAAVGVGRETAALLHAQSTEGLVSQLVALGRPEEALCAAREAQARRIQAVPHDPEVPEAIASASAHYAEARWEVDAELGKGQHSSTNDLERLKAAAARSEQALAETADEILRQRSTWRPACEDLTPRRPAELLLGLYPFQRGFMVLVQDDQGTEGRWIAGGLAYAPTDQRLGQELLEPLGARLEAAKAVRVLASDWAQGIDVHLLEWKGTSLVEHLPVVYGAELPQRTGAPEDPHRAKRALLVQDPTESLLGPEAEVRVIRAELARLGWEIEAPPPELADRQNLRDGLEQAGFFYYAGHAEHDVSREQSLWLPPYAGGTRAWPARLRLRFAPPATFDIQDILMLDSGAPAKIALIGCQTGVPGGAGGGMSLALAFLVAGADEVVATPEVTADAIGRATGEGLIAGFSRDGVSLADGLRAAQQGLLQRHEPVGRYRVWVR